jgi:hypothetical protein
MDAATKYGVMSTPTIVFIDGGDEVERLAVVDHPIDDRRGSGQPVLNWSRPRRPSAWKLRTNGT